MSRYAQNISARLSAGRNSAVTPIVVFLLQLLIVSLDVVNDLHQAILVMIATNKLCNGLQVGMTITHRNAVGYRLNHR
jgi:hypothetical protein